MDSRQSRSYDEIMEHKILLLQMACQDDLSLSTIPGLPCQYSNRLSSRKYQQHIGTNRSTEYSDSIVVATPQFTPRENHFSSPKQINSSLTKKLKAITQDIEETQISKIKSQYNILCGKRCLLLYEHAKKLKLKQSYIQVIGAKGELSECTFTPQIQKHRLVNTNPGDLVFDRLSRQTNKKFIPSKIDELKDCTFKPQIYQQKPLQIKTQKIQVQKIDYQKNIPGVDTQLRRLDIARQEKQRVQSFFETQQFKLQTQNERCDQPQSFAFNLSSKYDNKNDPVVFLDVKVSKAKIGRIGIRKGDNVQKLVQSFSKTFTISQDCQDRLEEQIQLVISKFYG